jgi:predicted MPP superfamily phosphohydrolase
MPQAPAPQARRPRRWFLKSVGVAAAGLAGGAVYTRWIEPRWLDVGRHEIALGKGPAGPPVRLLQLSDFHASPVVPLAFIARAVRAGLALKPDLICLTGDFITAKFADSPGYVATLAPLAAAAPTFACLGNHDGGSWAGSTYGYDDTSVIRDILARAGITLLHNSARAVTVAGRPIRLVGVGDLWAGELDASAAFSSPPGVPGTPTLLLAHNPDSKDEMADRTWDLMLSGHTHGGQLRLPVFGTPFAPVQDTRFVKGLHRWENRWLHVTKGVGNLHGLRFNCRPEISLLTLT